MVGVPGVSNAEGFLTGYTSMGDLPFFIVFGYQPRGRLIREFKLVDGDPLTTNRQILLGRVAAENLGYRVGQTIHVFDSSFKIVGIYETGVAMQDGGGIVTLRDAQRLFGQARKVSFVGVWLEHHERAAGTIAELEARFPEVSLSLATEFSEGLMDLEMMRSATWAISFVTLLVGGLGMTNTMVMSVFERTREIGVLRALGWRKGRVLAMIVQESVTLSVIGGVAGVLIGVVFGYLLNMTPFVQSWLRIIYTPSLFAQALLTALLLGVVGSIYPAWRASNLQPVEALRYE